MKSARVRLGVSAALAAGLLHTGCSQSNAGGGPSGTEGGNSVAVRVLQADSTAAVGVLVRVRWWDHLRSIPGVADSGPNDEQFGRDVYTGPNGEVDLSGLRAGRYRIEAIHSGTGAQTLVTLGDSPEPRSLVLGRWGRVEGSLPDGQKGSWVGVLGMDHRVRSDSLGHFRIDSLPRGAVELRLLNGTERGFAEVSPGRTNQVGPLRAELPLQLFLDDFEDGDTRHRYAIPASEGWWYAAMSAGLVSSPDSVPGNPERALFRDTATGSIHLRWMVSDSLKRPEAWAELGVKLGPKPVDLRGLKEIRFRSRGTGSLQLRIQSTRLASKQFLDAKVQLQSGWTNHRVSISAFRLTGSSNAPPDSDSLSTLLESCSGLSWSFGPEGSLDLDDILLDGVDALSLWGTLRAP